MAMAGLVEQAAIRVTVVRGEKRRQQVGVMVSVRGMIMEMLLRLPAIVQVHLGHVGRMHSAMPLTMRHTMKKAQGLRQQKREDDKPDQRPGRRVGRQPHAVKQHSSLIIT